MNKEYLAYYHFASKSRLDKAVNSLLGIVEGIAIDSKINEKEIAFLKEWIHEYEEYKRSHPFSELLPVVEEALADGILTKEEVLDISWLCEKLKSSEYYDKTTGDLQRLHALLGGIAADGVITEEELNGLSKWLEDHNHIRTCWPYDEIDSIVTAVMEDHKIDDKEHKLLLEIFSEFIQFDDIRTIVRPIILEDQTLRGICSVCPEINIEGSLFCFTGASPKYSRKEFSEIVTKLGGKFINSISKKVNYLVIGADGNPCWAYACYGRKVEEAVSLRKQGERIQLVHENDFHDAVADITGV